MKITHIETHVCHARMRNWVFVKVVTDQHGLVGWGEATLEWHTRSVVGAVEDLAELLVGEDPTRPEHLWQMMYRLGFSQPSYIICETVHNDVPWRQDVVQEGFTVEKKGRIVRPNTKPGLGITINEAEVKKHPFQQEVLLREFGTDGSVTDW